MPSFEEVDRSLRQQGLFFNKGEKQDLAAMLRASEIIVAAVGGVYNDARGLLVATNERIIFLDKTFTGRRTSEDFSYDRVTGVLWHGGWFSGSIVVVAASHRAIIKEVNTRLGPKLVAEARELMNSVQNYSAVTTKSGAGIGTRADDIAGQLERLAALMDRGILSREEFEMQKRKLLEG